MSNQATEVIHEVLTWAAYGEGSKALAQQVADDGYQTDIILAIARGGLLVAGAVSYALQVKNVFVMNVEYYTGEDQRLEFPIVLPPVLSLVDLRDSRVLVADDVADTGNTLAMVMDLCRPEVAEIRSAVLYEKPHSIVKSDYVWRRTDRWIDFPWSSRSALVGPPEAEPGRHGTTA